MLQILGLMCYGFAVIDIFSFYALGYDVTGVWYSPWLAGFLGGCLTRGDAEG